MAKISDKFITDSKIKALDNNYRNILNISISNYQKAFINTKKQFNNLDITRKLAANIKHKVIDELDNYLIEFEAKFNKNGGKVIWAESGNIAVNEILKILQKHKVKKVVKSKSSTSDEIGLKNALKKNDNKLILSNIGEYIEQKSGYNSGHITSPAIDLSKEDISKILNKKFNTPEKIQTEEIITFIRKLLREKFTNTDVGITGANFLISDIGGIALTENEGNAAMLMSFPKIHIVIAGIEKLIPSINDLDIFWPLLSTYGTGQNITVYNSIITGPKQKHEINGPEEMYVILLDNNRTELLKKEKQRRALSCIRCGACLNNCPVYKNIGGHTYGTTYSGPIGAVITPYLNGMDEYKHLSFASSLCGNCSENCPVNIPLHKLILVLLPSE